MVRVSAFFHFDEEGTSDRSQNTNPGQNQRQDNRRKAIESITIVSEFRSRHKRSTQNHRSNNRANIRLEQVSTHAGDVAHVVADVISDGGRVQRVIFRDTSFDFTNQVSTDVGGLGIDTTTHACEQSDRRGTEREASQNGNDFYDFSLSCTEHG